MPLSLNDFIDILAEICENKQLKCSIKSSLRGGLITGTSAAIGGLLLGPIGLAIGGALGGAAAAANSERFQPVPNVLKNLSQAEKKKLYDRVAYAFRNFGPQDITALAALIASGTAMQNLAIEEVTKYLTNEMGLSVS